MVKFSEAVILDEKLLKKLNNKVDEIIDEKDYEDLDYDALQRYFKRMVSVIPKRPKTRRIPSLETMTKQEMIKTALHFFKSLDEEFYREALDVILQNKESVSLNIYNFHEIKDFEERDEHGIKKYTTTGCVDTDGVNRNVCIPIQEEMSQEEAKLIGNSDLCTLNDLHTFVHEISHLFDFSPKREILVDGSVKEIEHGNEFTRELLAESTACSFEGLLTDYLLKNTSYSRSEIFRTNENSVNYLDSCAKMVYTKLLLADEKEKNSVITDEFLRRTMMDYQFTPDFMRKSAEMLIDSDCSLAFEKRYAIAGLVCPTIVKKTVENKGLIKKYISAIKEDDYEKALGIYGITLDEQGLGLAIRNLKSRDFEYEKEK